MPRGWNRTETWVALIVVAVGLLLAAVAGLHTYMTATATSLHPDVAAVPSVADADPAPPWIESAERARTAVRQAVSVQNLPGLSVAVGFDGELVWAEGFGWANLENRTHVTPATRFHIGTASTVLTSVVVGRLLEQGALSLDADIRTYVPEYPAKPWPMTARQLMGHLAGVRSDGGDEGPLFAEHCTRPVDALTAFADSDLLVEPGTAYRYSSYGWILVSAAIEAAADESLRKVMQAHVFDPAAMNETSLGSASATSIDRATSYFPRYAADPRYGLHLMRDVDHSCYSGAADVVSTPSDLVRFAMAADNGTLLQPETLQMLQTSQRLPSGEETGYGLGWDLETVSLAGDEHRIAGHDGHVLGGAVASLITLRDHDLVVAVTSNISYADTSAVALAIAEAFVVRPEDAGAAGATIEGRRSESR